MIEINKQVIIPDGAQVGPNASIGQGSILTSFVTVESGAEIEHGVVFAGRGPRRTVVRSCSLVGAGAVIGDGVELRRGCVVRPGSVVLDSVPANAIVQGNPAGIVGYTSGIPTASIDTGNDLASPLENPAHSIIPLGIGTTALYKMRRVTDFRGALTVGEVANELPFTPKRYFLVFDVPSRELRGEHAHKECHQFLICVHGSCRILLDDGKKRREVLLNRPDVGVYMPPLIWGTQFLYSLDAAILVFASHVYDPGDYIRTYDEFLSIVEE